MELEEVMDGQQEEKAEKPVEESKDEIKEESKEDTKETAEIDPIEIVKPLKREKTAKERIAELTWRAKEAERQLAAEKAKKETPAPVPRETGRPRLEQFETTEEYEDAVMKWHLQKTEENYRQETAREREREALRSFDQRAMKVREIHDDFDEVIENPVLTPVMKDVLIKSEQGPVIAYYLGHPENATVARRIASMPSELQSYEIGKLEAQLLQAQKSKKVTSAPAPIKPLSGASGSVVDEESMSDDEWFKLEKKRQIEKLQKKYGG